MKTSLYKYLALPYLLLSTLSCVRDTDLDAGEPPKVVVECVLSDEPLQVLHLSYTKSVSHPAYPPVGNAEARLLDLSSGERIGNFTYNPAQGRWELPYSAVPGHSYRLEVEVAGQELIHARQEMPLSTLDYEYISMFSGGGDLPKEYKSYDMTVFRFRTIDAPAYCWIYGQVYHADTGSYEHVGKICTDYAYADPFNITGESYVPVNDSYPFLEGTALHRDYLRIPLEADKVGQGDAIFSHFVVSGSFSNQAGTDGENARVNVIFVSAQYDRFLRDALQYAAQQESSSLADIYLRDNLYSNINGGIGIFGAKTAMSCSWRSGKPFLK